LIVSSNPVVPFRGAKDHADAEADRQDRLFAWAKRVLQKLGLDKKVEQANSFEELRKIVLDVNAVDVILAIQNAMHPPSGRKDDCFVGLTPGGLKKVLQNRFADMKKDREKKLKERGGAAASGRRSSYDWTNDLTLDDKGNVRPLLKNEIL
jgi:hypothetical protein